MDSLFYGRSVGVIKKLDDTFQRLQGAGKFGNQHVNWASMGIVFVVTYLTYLTEINFVWQNAEWN